MDETTYILVAEDAVVSPQVLVEELKQRLEQCHLKGVDDDETAEKAGQARRSPGELQTLMSHLLPTDYLSHF